jgi:hypothetical protein
VQGSVFCFVTSSSKFRPALQELLVYPRALQEKLPVWLGVGGTPASFVRAGSLGLPLTVAVIGGNPWDVNVKFTLLWLNYIWTGNYYL